MLNVVALMGRLVADSELRHTPNDVAVTSFTIAVDRSYVKSGTERQADFIDIVAWRGTADFVCKYFRRGQLIAVQGAIQTRSYTDSQGNKRKAFEIVADNVHLRNQSESRIIMLILSVKPHHNIQAEIPEILRKYRTMGICLSKGEL